MTRKTTTVSRAGREAGRRGSRGTPEAARNRTGRTARASSPRAEERRKSIIRAAIKVFAKKGYHAATMGEVVARAGIAKGTAYWYFPSKKDLFLAVLEEVSDAFRREVRAAALEHSSPMRRLEEAVRKGVIMAGIRPHLFKAYFQDVPWEEPQFQKVRKEIMSRFARELASTYRAAASAGEARQVDPELAARAILGMVDYLAREVVEKGASAEEAAEFAVALLRRGLALDSSEARSAPGHSGRGR